MSIKNYIYEDKITIPAKAFNKTLPVALGGFDKGCSLTKVASGRYCGDNVVFTCLTFGNNDLDASIKWMEEEIERTSDSVFRVTGVGGDATRNVIGERLKCKCEWVDECVCQHEGVRFLLQHGDPNEIFYPDPDLAFEGVFGGNISTSWVAPDAVATEENLDYPTLFCFFGSALGITVIHEDGTCNTVSGALTGGKTFFGLAHLILGTTNFQEIDRLAKQGDKTKVDIMPKDEFEGCTGSAYSNFPHEMSVFPMAKVAGKSLEDENISKADLAAGLFTVITEFVFTLLMGECQRHNAKRIIIGGNFVRSDYFRQLFFTRHNAVKAMYPPATIKFMKTGHTGVFGAMIVESQSKD